MISTYLDKLVDDLTRKPERATRVRLRTLLREFGYSRRQRDALTYIKGALQARGLAAELSPVRPLALDDPVVIRLVAPSRLRALPDTLRRQAWSGLRVPRRGEHPTGRRDAAGAVTPADTRDPSARQGELPATETRAGFDPAAEDLSGMAEQAVTATVEIQCAGGIGAGVIVHPDGLVLTARHVVHDGYTTCREVGVRLSDGTRLRGIVFRSHWPLDLALLWLERAGPFAHLPLGDSTALRVAQPLIAVGHPSAFRNTVTKGIVSNPRAHYNGIECLQTDTAMDEGSSGGPLLTSSGEVVAVSTWKWGDLDSGKFAVPVDYFIDDIEEAVALGRQRCLKGRYCLACGHLEVDRSLQYCPACGSERVVHGSGRH